MYVFNNIELLIALGDTGVLNKPDTEIYVTDMILESDCYEYYVKTKLRLLINKGIVTTFNLKDDFFKFALMQQIPYPGIDIMAFASIYFAKQKRAFLVTSNPTIKKCALNNNVAVPGIKDLLLTILKEEKYVELFMTK